MHYQNPVQPESAVYPQNHVCTYSLKLRTLNKAICTIERSLVTFLSLEQLQWSIYTIPTVYGQLSYKCILIPWNALHDQPRIITITITIIIIVIICLYNSSGWIMVSCLWVFQQNSTYSVAWQTNKSQQIPGHYLVIFYLLTLIIWLCAFSLLAYSDFKRHIKVYIFT